MVKNTTNFDKVSLWLMGYSFVYGFIFTNAFVLYLMTESILVHFNLYSDIFTSYLISLALAWVINSISSHTIGSQGLMGIILKKDKLQNDGLGIKFVDSSGGFLICGLIAVILKSMLNIKISQATVDSSKLIQYMIMGCILTFLTTTIINIFIRRNTS